MWNEEEEKQNEIKQAEAVLIKTEAAILLASNNWIACEIHIAGLKIGICNNTEIIPALEAHKKEIQKFLNGEPNMYE